MSDLFPTSKALEVPEEEIQAAKVFIKDYLRKHNKVRGSLNAQITRMIKDCVEGWPTAPHTFKERILSKLGMKPDLTPKGRPLENKTQAEKDLINSTAAAKRTGRNMTEGDNDWLDLQVTLNNSEKLYMDKRFDQYKEDFELNDSSDVPIIRQIILEEIIQRRVQNEALKASRGEVVEPNITKLLTDSYDRMHKAQELLGISGRQRIKKMTNAEGSIAELNQVYLKTLEEYPGLEIRWEAEEILLLLRKHIRGEIREVDFKQLCPGNLSIDDAKLAYNDFIDRGILDREKDNLDKDNFGRFVKDLPQFNYQPILQHLVSVEDDQDIHEDTSIEDVLKDEPGSPSN